jgi:hypothetical protein
MGGDRRRGRERTRTPPGGGQSRNACEGALQQLEIRVGKSPLIGAHRGTVFQAPTVCVVHPGGGDEGVSRDEGDK